MSSPTDQQEKIDYSDWKTKMIAHSESGCLIKADETSTCNSSEIHFNSSEANFEPRDEGERENENSLTKPAMQAAMFRRRANDIERLEDETSDSTHLLEGHCNRSNGEGCFENESVFQTDDMIQSCVEDAATRHENVKGNFYQRLDNYGKDSQNVAKNSKSEVQPQPEILLRPLSLPSESSSSRPSIREDFEIDAPSSFVNPTSTKKQSSSTVQHIGAETSSSYHSIKPTGTKKHFSSTAQYGGSESGSIIPSSHLSIKPIGPKEHSSPTSQHIRAELGPDPIVHFTKPTASRQHPNPTSESGRENRHIFETGGELSRYPPAGVSYAGGDEIELLPLGESPEPQIVISPSGSSDEPSVNCCKLGKVCFCRGIGLLKQRTARQFSKYPFFYLCSTLTIMISVITWDKATTDRDVSATIFFSFMTFIFITLIVDRGQFSHALGGWKTCIPQCRRGCGRADPCIPLCCCCRSSEPQLERHSQYRHLEEDGAFKHEIADVSKLDPKDCPQMKMVELRESDHADSPDFIPEVSQVNADVHVEKQDGEKLGAARKHFAKGTGRTTRPHETRSDKARPSPTKIFAADVHASDHVTFMPPEQSLIPRYGMRNGEEQQQEDRDDSGTTELGATSKNPADDLGAGDFSRATVSDSRRFSGEYYKKFSDCSPTVPRFASDIRQSDDLSDYSRSEDGGRSTSPEDQSFPADEGEIQSDVGAFMCEHYGQSVACSCPTLLGRR